MNGLIKPIRYSKQKKKKKGRKCLRALQCGWTLRRYATWKATDCMSASIRNVQSANCRDKEMSGCLGREQEAAWDKSPPPPHSPGDEMLSSRLW